MSLKLLFQACALMQVVKDLEAVKALKVYKLFLPCF